MRVGGQNYLRIKDRGGGRRIEALEDGLGDELEEKGDTADKERVSCFVCVLREDKGYCLRFSGYTLASAISYQFHTY